MRPLKKNRYFFKHEGMDFETLIALGTCSSGAGEAGEILSTCARIKDGDFESWYREWSVTAGRVLKIVPSTDRIWKQCLEEGLIKVFKDVGALVGSAGCAGCASGQIGQTGKGEISISSGNRNFEGKQGEGDIYLASPATVAASLVAGYITVPDKIPEKPGQSSIPVAKPHVVKRTGRSAEPQRSLKWV